MTKKISKKLQRSNIKIIDNLTQITELDSIISCNKEKINLTKK